tara:strand:+ start:115846 stop:116505 length:660 start_codon:yes stop_codon:yes gene_type:complete
MNNKISILTYKKLFTLLAFALLVSSVKARITKNERDGEFVFFHGKVISRSGENILVMPKNSKKQIIVEVDDEVKEHDSYNLMPGDDVRITGFVDQDALEKFKVEASTVYVKNINSFIFVSGVDEEGAPLKDTDLIFQSTIPGRSQSTLNGKVTKIGTDFFVVDTGLRKVKVLLSQISYDPLDDVGFTQIDIGDKVLVSGILNKNDFINDRLIASYIIEK